MYSNGNGVVTSAVSPALQQAYLNSEYRVLTESPFRFRIGQACTELARLLRDRVPPYGFFITAYNPFSIPLPEAENRSATRSLAARLESYGVTVWQAEGLDPTGDWPPEPGFLVAGLSLDSARWLGTEYDQNAIVRIGANGRSELLLLR